MFWKNKKVLISGGTGFIGKNLVQKLLQKEAVPVPFGRDNCDLTNWDNVKEYFSKQRDIDYIIHLATYQRTGNIQYKIKADQFDVNVKMHLNMLNGWRDYLSKAKLISVGCSCSYPQKNTPLTEKDYWAGKLHDSVDSYGFAKKLMQVGQRAYSEQYGLKSLYVIMSTVYGPGDNFEDGHSHFIAALIKKIVHAQKNNIQEVEIWGDGSQVREYLYIDDQIDALLIAAEKLDSELINIGANCSCTVREVAECIRDIVDYKGVLIFNPDKFTGVQYKVLDSNYFKKLTNWSPKATLGAGIEATVQKYPGNLGE